MIFTGNQWDFSRVVDIDLKPDLIVDVGVANGTPELYRTFPDVNVLLIEPNSEWNTNISDAMGDRPYSLINKAVGKVHGKANLFHDNKRPHQSSLYKRSFHDDTTIEVDTETLDCIMEDVQGEQVILKIDVEGAELDVLLGAAETLKRTICCFVEVNMGFTFDEPRNSLPEVDKIMKDNRFVLYSIMDSVKEGNDKETKITKVDLCYIKE